MSKPSLDSLDPRKFMTIIESREKAAASASGVLNTEENYVNRFAKEMHPLFQYMVVSEVIAHNSDCKTYRLIPDKEKGTAKPAYFTSGQYVGVFADIDGKNYERPYTISSSPEDALKGFYEITVKKVNGGKVSGYIINNFEKGTKVKISGPMGNFTYEPLRDKGHIVCLAGGSGITPFLSLAKAVKEGTEDCNLTIFYGCKTEREIIYKNELDNLQSDKIKIIYVLSDERRENCEYGFIDSSLIRKYTDVNSCSYFICGPKEMYKFLEKETEKFGIERKYIRYEMHGEILNPDDFEDCPENIPQMVEITVWAEGEKVKIKGNSKNTVLRILEENGINPPVRCRSGECGFCRTRLVNGQVFVPWKYDKRRQADEKYGYIHPCFTYPVSDLEIEIFTSLMKGKEI